MSFIAKLFGGGTKGVGQLAKDIREAIKGKEMDPNQRLEVAAKLAEVQAKINEAEATHRSIFVAGWRPFIGWVCGVALCWHFILQPITVMIIRLAGYEQVILPDFDFSQLSTILMGMLGLGGLRTFEKMKGVSREQ